MSINKLIYKLHMVQLSILVETYILQIRQLLLN